MHQTVYPWIHNHQANYRIRSLSLSLSSYEETNLITNCNFLKNLLIFMQFGEILGHPPQTESYTTFGGFKKTCKHIFQEYAFENVKFKKEDLNSDEDECNGLWFSSSDFSIHVTEFHKRETKYLNSDLEDTRCGYEIVAPGNMIPVLFEHRSGGSISFWIGSEFHTLALCFAFDLPRGNNYSYICDVHISINGFKRELKAQLFEEMNIGHLWFYYIPQSSLQQLFIDLNLDSWNFVKVLCRISCWTSENTKLPPIIRRCGVRQICGCRSEDSIIVVKPANHPLDSIFSDEDELDMGMSLADHPSGK